MGLKITIAVITLGLFIAYQLVDHFDPETVKSKNVIITGSSTGIGEQMAYHYARLGANILITARREEQLQQVIQKCKDIGNENGGYYYISLDMADHDAPLELIKYAEFVFGRIDYIVLNHMAKTHFGEWLATADNFTLLEKTFTVNFNSYVRIASHGLPYLEASQGSIVVMSSTFGKVPTPYMASYTASKHALQGFFGSLQQELIMRNNGISVTICTIGLVGTESTITALEKFKPGVLKKIPIGDPSDTALSVIKGAAQRWNDLYYPRMVTTVFVYLYNFLPETYSAIIRYTWS